MFKILLFWYIILSDELVHLIIFRPVIILLNVESYLK